ncbi:succinate--CoA ligase beta chain [Gnomoniopsis sp. IMI 355080]|nr:succinate--CoA ligase beta chain [Gnomoniopsis sp. IMI 355080]
MFRLARSRAVASAFAAPKASSIGSGYSNFSSSLVGLQVSPAIRTPAFVQQKRNLSIHEYLSADLLRQYNIDVPKGANAKNAAEAEAVAKQIGGDDMVIKAQVLAGGRGKGTFDNGLKGGVRVIYSPTEAKLLAENMIGHKLITKQTGAAGRLCSSVYICERKFARREFYLAVLMDRASQGPVIVSSSQGGMDIEGVAKENPDAIHTTYIDINVGVTDEMALDIANKLGFSEQCIPEAKETIQNLYKIFCEKDATQIEINPLSETSDHKVMCMDAKFGFDDNADFRQKDIFAMRDETQEDADEVRAAKSGLNFIKLDGDIGCLVNGAGLAMATMDIIKLNGGQPANFLDVGGGATPAAIKEAFELITSDSKVSAIFVNIFGGIVRCDAIANGLINTVKALDLKIPIIARLQGTNMEAAHALINDSGMKIFSIDDLQSAAERAVQLSKIVKTARDIDVGVEFTLGI